MKVGDLYLDLNTGDIYKYTTQWSKIGNIKGADGQNGQNGQNGSAGSTGAAGADGNTWTVGEGAPTGTAKNGDMYYDKTGCVVYQYSTTESKWVSLGSIKGPSAFSMLFTPYSLQIFSKMSRSNQSTESITTV